MKYTVIGDPHATPKNLDKLETLLAQVESLGNPTIFLGDMLDTKEIVRGKCLNFWIDYFTNSKLEHVVLVGNHDWFNLECKDHSLKALKSLDNVILVDKPTILEHFIAVPYLHDREDLAKVIKDAKKRQKALVGHFEIASFDFGNGQICTDGLLKNDFKDIPLVVSGHFHKKSHEKNILYVGTPFTHSFGEANQKKSIAVIEFNIPYSNIEYIETKLPAHLSIETEVNKITNKTVDGINNLAKKNYVRLLVSGTREDLNLRDFSNIDSSVKIIKKFSDTVMSKERVNEELSNEAQFLSWAKDIKKLEDATVSLGLSILKGE